MKLADIELEVTRLDPKPGDIVHVSISRKVKSHEMDEIMQSVRRLMPEGVTLMLTTPETSVRLERADADKRPDWHYYGSTNHPVAPHPRTQCSDEFCGPRAYEGAPPQRARTVDGIR